MSSTCCVGRQRLDAGGALVAKRGKSDRSCLVGNACGGCVERQGLDSGSALCRPFRRFAISPFHNGAVLSISPRLRGVELRATRRPVTGVRMDEVARDPEAKISRL
ncbi:hypothetical protein AXF42_Ash017702 [Apostasia shenzhenica]|uniref:Uncharacterized protein n=1 Tax=Apostasia shenzhenica TaxID=1088818 RepID=A0A2I0B612_9ASPA|nr:hypothetical protein AXF42_Ash017702 [Apostasia shenzhenica]